MTEENKPKDTTNREMAIRSSALDMAIRAECYQSYDTQGKRLINDPDRLISAASKIEQYIKNGNGITS